MFADEFPGAVFIIIYNIPIYGELEYLNSSLYIKLSFRLTIA